VGNCQHSVSALGLGRLRGLSEPAGAVSRERGVHPGPADRLHVSARFYASDRVKLGLRARRTPRPRQSPGSPGISERAPHVVVRRVISVDPARAITVSFARGGFVSARNIGAGRKLRLHYLFQKREASWRGVSFERDSADIALECPFRRSESAVFRVDPCLDADRRYCGPGDCVAAQRPI